jgi:hypothetical protein
MEITPHLGIGDLLLVKMKEISNGLKIDQVNVSTDLIQTYKNPEFVDRNLSFLDNFLNLLFPYAKINKINNLSNQYNHLMEYEIKNIYLYDAIFQKENKFTFKIDYKDYIIFHTKVRIDNYAINFINNDLPILNEFLKNFKTNKKIIIMGERNIEPNLETIQHNVISIYENLLELKKNNIVIDLTEEMLCSGNPNFQQFLYQMELINKADCNIVFSIGGNFCLVNSFAKNKLCYTSKCDHYSLSIFKNTNPDFYFDNINDLIDQINNKFLIKNETTNELCLPVSLGEAIDKLTILDIKCDKIKDHRKNDVEKEYLILYGKLKEFIEKYNDLYQSMKKVNLIIWDQMDVLRDSTISDEDYIKLCKECIVSNDIRFRIKNKINLISNSSLKEQKSYKINRLILDIHCDEKLFSLFIEPIKYFSFIYDEIIIVSKKNVNVIKETFYYDSTIKFENEFGNIEYKEYFTFSKNDYTKDEIYSIMNINRELLDLYI